MTYLLGTSSPGLSPKKTAPPIFLRKSPGDEVALLVDLLGKRLSIRMTETRFYEPARMSTPLKPFLSLNRWTPQPGLLCYCYLRSSICEVVNLDI